MQQEANSPTALVTNPERASCTRVESRLPMRHGHDAETIQLHAIHLTSDDRAEIGQNHAIVNRTAVSSPEYNFCSWVDHCVHKILIARESADEEPDYGPPINIWPAFENTSSWVRLSSIHCCVDRCSSYFETFESISPLARYVCSAHNWVDAAIAIGRDPNQKSITFADGKTIHIRPPQNFPNHFRWRNAKRTTAKTDTLLKGRSIAVSDENKSSETGEGDDPQGRRLQHQELEILPPHIEQYNPARWVCKERVRTKVSAEFWPDDGTLVRRWLGLDGVASGAVYDFDMGQFALVDDTIAYPKSRFNALDSYNIEQGEPAIDKFSTIQRYHYIRRLRLKDFSCARFGDYATWTADRHKRPNDRRPFVYCVGKKDFVIDPGEWTMHIAPHHNFGGPSDERSSVGIDRGYDPSKDLKAIPVPCIGFGTKVSELTRDQAVGEERETHCDAGRAHSDREPRKYILSTPLKLTTQYDAVRHLEPDGVEPVMKAQDYPTVVDWIRQTVEGGNKLSRAATMKVIDMMTSLAREEGATVDTLARLMPDLLGKFARFWEIEFEYVSPAEIARRPGSGMTAGAVQKEYERMRQRVLECSTLQDLEDDMDYNAEEFDLKQLSLEQLQKIRSTAGVYAMLPKLNRYVECYRLPDNTDPDRGLVMKESRELLIAMVMNQAFKKAMHKQVVSKSSIDGKTGADFVQKAKAARLKAGEWARRASIVDYGTPEHPTAAIAAVIAEIESRMVLQG